jgi:hypothetical protein
MHHSRALARACSRASALLSRFGVVRTEFPFVDDRRGGVRGAGIDGEEGAFDDFLLVEGVFLAGEVVPRLSSAHWRANANPAFAAAFFAALEASLLVEFGMLTMSKAVVG